MNHLRKGLSQSWLIIQDSLFPWLQEELGALTERQQKFVMILELIPIEEHLNGHGQGSVGLCLIAPAAFFSLPKTASRF